MRTFILLFCLALSPVLAQANSGEKKAEENAGPVIEYIEMKPKFTVNLAEPKRYLMINVQLLVEGAEHVEKSKTYAVAAARNDHDVERHARCRSAIDGAARRLAPENQTTDYRFADQNPKQRRFQRRIFPNS